MLKNIISIIGFIILLLIGIWSAIQVIKFVPRLFSDTGVSTPVSTIEERTTNPVKLNGRDIASELSATTARSGDAVTLSWAHSGDETGVLSFAYGCTEGFYFQIADRPVPCNAPYNIPTSDTSLEITPISSLENVEAPLAITYTNAEGESVRDAQTLTVVNDTATLAATDTDTTPTETPTTTTSPTPTTNSEEGPVEPVQPSPTNTYGSGTSPQSTTDLIRVPRTSNPYGTPDLAVEMIGIGEINARGAFEGKGFIHPYARGAAKFKVTNLGDKESGPWTFSAFLPTQGGYPFNSRPQPTLMPGSSIDILVTFDQLVPGTHNFSVTADPNGYIYELSEFNNSTGQPITVLHY